MKQLELTEKQTKVIQGKICWYCGTKTELKNTEYGYQYKCPQCGAYVGCHKGTKKALGRVADKELRAAKMLAHKAFDVIWKTGYMSRSEAYKWLGEKLDLPKKYVHIGYFGIDTCTRVVYESQMFVFGKGK